MKRVLILAYDFPPYMSVGAIRPHSWAEQLQKFGYHPVIVTRQWRAKEGSATAYVSYGFSDEVVVEENATHTIVQAPFKPHLGNRILLKYGTARFALVRKALSFFYEIMQWFTEWGAKASLLHAAREYLKREPVDIIIATGDPYVLFRYASILSSEFKKPWVADYRDPWVHVKRTWRNRLYIELYAFLERNVLQSASAITAVDALTIQLLKSDYYNKRIHLIRNGYAFDRADNHPEEPRSNAKFKLVLMGTITPWEPLDSVLSVLDDFLSQRPDAAIELDFIGISDELSIREKIRKTYLKLASAVRFFPKVGPHEVQAYLLTNDAAILFNHYHIMGTKIYDYLGLELPILLFYTNDQQANALRMAHYPYDYLPIESLGPQAETISALNAGYVFENQDSFRSALPQLYDEFVRHGQIKIAKGYGHRFSREEQTKLLAQLFDELLASGNI